MKIIFFNAPPKSGKDTLIDNYMHNHGYYRFAAKLKLADPLKKSLVSLLGLTQEEFLWFDNEYKDVPDERLMGYTWRQLCIKMSEDFVKVNFDKYYFGKILTNTIDNYLQTYPTYKTFIISDLGFNEELVPCVDKFGSENISVIKLYRDGHTFDNDSRYYVDCKALNIKEYHLENNGNLGSSYYNCNKLIEEILND